MIASPLGNTVRERNMMVRQRGGTVGGDEAVGSMAMRSNSDVVDVARTGGDSTGHYSKS
jgi:hypothetical protein